MSQFCFEKYGYAKIGVLTSVSGIRATYTRSRTKIQIVFYIICCNFFQYFFNFNFFSHPKYECKWFVKRFGFWQKFRFLTKVSIFDKGFDCWQKFGFLTKISIFDKNFDFWQKFRFLTKISIFDKSFETFFICLQNSKF